MAKIDQKAAFEVGREIPIDDLNEKTFTVLYAEPSSNARYSAALNRAMTRDFSKLPAHKRAKCMNLAFAQGAIITWSGITYDDVYDDGNHDLINFSVQACLDWLNNTSNASDRETVISAMTDEALFEKRKTEELIKKQQSTFLESGSETTMKQPE